MGAQGPANHHSVAVSPSRPSLPSWPSPAPRVQMAVETDEERHPKRDRNTQ